MCPLHPNGCAGSGFKLHGYYVVMRWSGVPDLGVRPALRCCVACSSFGTSSPGLVWAWRTHLGRLRVHFALVGIARVAWFQDSYVCLAPTLFWMEMNASFGSLPPVVSGLIALLCPCPLPLPPLACLLPHSMPWAVTGSPVVHMCYPGKGSASAELAGGVYHSRSYIGLSFQGTM